MFQKCPEIYDIRETRTLSFSSMYSIYSTNLRIERMQENYTTYILQNHTTNYVTYSTLHKANIYNKSLSFLIYSFSKNDHHTVRVCCPTSTSEPLNRIPRNLLYILCHYSTHQCSSFKFPTIRNNMRGAQTFEAKAILAPLHRNITLKESYVI